MSGKRKSQYIGLLLIFIMFFSTIGFAVINSVYNPDVQQGGQPTASSQAIERHTKRLLTGQEKASLLKNGVPILEFLHTVNCQKCADYRPLIEGFSTKYNMILVDAESTENTVQFTGRTTKAVGNVTEKELLDAYCQAAFAQPKDCVLKDF